MPGKKGRVMTEATKQKIREAFAKKRAAKEAMMKKASKPVNMAATQTQLVKLRVPKKTANAISQLSNLTGQSFDVVAGSILAKAVQSGRIKG